MAGMMMLGSAGQHLLQPVTSSISIALSSHENRGRRMGQVGSIETLCVVIGTGSVWLFLDKASPQYRFCFAVSAGLALVAAAFYFVLNVPKLEQKRSRMVLRKKFWLYYMLEFLFGARKQIFITFGPWVLIKVYGAPATDIAGLLMLGAGIGIFFKPMIGAAIDHFGERRVLIVDGFLVAVVCLGYGYAMAITGDKHTALWLASGCLVADNLLFATGTGRAIYLSRLTHDPQEITSTLAMGISINHIVSMTIPILAGTIWERFGYEKLFLSACFLAIAIGFLATRVPGKNAVQVRAS